MDEYQGTWFGRRVVLVLLGVLLMFFSPWLGTMLLLLALIIHVASRYDPKPVSARHFNKALELEKGGDYEAAVKELNQSLETRPSNLLSLAKLITVLMDRVKDFERALPFTDAFIAAAPYPTLESLPPDPLLGTVFKTNCLFELGRFDDVITLIQRSDIETLASPDVVEHLQLLLGRAFFENGSYEVAAEQLLKGPVRSRKRDDDTVMEFRYWLGLAYLKSGEKRKAKTQLAKVYAADTDFRDIAEYAEEAGLV